MNEKVKKQKVILSGVPQIEQNIQKKRFETEVEKEVKKQKKDFKLRNYVIPDNTTDVAFEKMLKRISTRGVVKLFNLVMKHKQTMNVQDTKKKAGNPRRKKKKNKNKKKKIELILFSFESHS